ncbi:phage tail protein [Clostridium sp. MCC353]|uniref:phage tail protein n=1 Tax=Clostridium sp. MCC353 TaxID=2592646 RepID=UPI001C028154|nr:phage tail protein [Clostridium sp. MCC353]MBT9777197.1 phage tail protein [Clostridium sp. MCC353]
MAGYPQVKFRFKLEIDGLEAGGFSEVSGFDAPAEPIEYRAGDMAAGMAAGAHLKVAGLRKYGNITLKKGMIEGKAFYDWILKGQNGEVDRRTVIIKLLDETQMVAASWRVINAWPAKYSGCDFNAASNEITVETLELAHEGMARDL